MSDLDGLYQDPNGPAYVKREERVGPPLAYVQEKIASSLRELHDVIGSLVEHVPDDLPAPNQAAGNPFQLKRDYLVGPARHAFYYELVAFLALSNVLAIANESVLVDRLLTYSRKEFADPSLPI
jgi:hypothetical protein